jgi:alpha-mannosidase
MRTLHVVSHTHWDREWYQTFQQFRLKLVQLVDGLLDILEHDPEFKYFMLDGQTIVLEDYLLLRPEQEPVIRAHVQSGRIVIGPWHILPDMFLVGPESHIRNLLEGERTARKFGPKMMVGYMPDSFGHIGQMPQILRGFGIGTASLWRGLQDEPPEFWWQSPDGSRVLMAYLRDSYSNGAFLPSGETFPLESMPRFAEALAERGQSLAEHSAASDLLIMLGTDHMQPPPNTSRNLAYADHNLPDTRVLHSTLERYFEALKPALDQAQLPTVQGELRSCKHIHLLPGVLSTRMWIKQRNTASENLLTAWVEPFSTFAGLLEAAGQPSRTRLRAPSAIIRQAWRLLMENHPHDSICGCSIDQVHDEMKIRFDQVDQIGEELTRQNLETLAAHIDTIPAAPALGSLVVFNPSGFSRTDLVSAEVSLGPGASDFALLDQDGRVLPYETLGLGVRELINALMSPREFKAAFNMVNDGRVTGLGVRAYTSRREGERMHLDITLAEGEPDHAVWERAVLETNAMLADAGIASYQVRAHTPDVARVLFAAPEIPALGWRVFTVQAVTRVSAPIRLSPLARAMLPLAGQLARLPLGRLAAQIAPVAGSQKSPGGRNERAIENEFFRVEVQPDGTLSVLDKRSGSTFPGLNRFVDGGDCGDEYNYSPPAINPQHTARLKSVSVQRSAVRQVLSLELLLKTPASLSEDRKSRSHTQVEIPITSEVSLTNGVARLDIHTRLENLAKDHRLRVHFPAPLKLESASHDGHFEVLQRRIGIPAYDRQYWMEDPRPEVPQRAFSSLSDGARGLTLANRGLPEVEALKSGAGTELALTLLRCVGWLSRDDLQTRRGHAGPGLETPGAQLPGVWEFDYALIPHDGPYQGEPRRQAYAFGSPLRAVAAALHPGGLPGRGSFLQIETSGGEFTLSAVKPAEDGNGWLARGYNPGPETLQVTFTPLVRCTHAARLNLDEQKITNLPVDESTGSLSLPVKAHEIVTVWFGDAPKE